MRLIDVLTKEEKEVQTRIATAKEEYAKLKISNEKELDALKKQIAQIRKEIKFLMDKMQELLNTKYEESSNSGWTTTPGTGLIFIPELELEPSTMIVPLTSDEAPT